MTLKSKPGFLLLVKLSSKVFSKTKLMYLSSHKVPTHIVDSVFTGDNEDIIAEEIKKANVICLVYAVSDFACFERVESYWLPLLTRLCTQYVPVILAGNKTDKGRDARLTVERVDAVVNAFDIVEVNLSISYSL